MASQPPKVNTKGGSGSGPQRRKPSGDGKLAPGAKAGAAGMGKNGSTTSATKKQVVRGGSQSSSRSNDGVGVPERFQKAKGTKNK